MTYLNIMDGITLIVLAVIVIFLVGPMVAMHFTSRGVGNEDDVNSPTTLDGGHPCPYWGMLDKDLYNYEVVTDVPMHQRTWQSFEDFKNRKVKEG